MNDYQKISIIDDINNAKLDDRIISCETENDCINIKYKEIVLKDISASDDWPWDEISIKLSKKE